MMPEQRHPLLISIRGRRIASHAGSAVPYLQDTEADKTQATPLFEVLGDGRHQVGEYRLGLPFRDLMARRKLRRQMFQSC